MQARFDELGGYALEARAREILAGLGFSQEVMDGDVGALSGGWKMRVALARILLMRPDAMLLDEPTNHLDIESIIWLESSSRAFEGALIMTSHDREFMNRIVTKIVEIDGGELTTYSGNYDFYEQQRALVDAAGRGAVRAPAGDARQGEALHRALQGARQPRRAGAVAREEARQDREGRAAQAPQGARVRLPHGRRARATTWRSSTGVSKGYGKRVIYEGFDLLIRRRERWCVMGVNGAGKSTLLKLVAGETEPDAGNVTLGASVKLGYFAQHAMEILDAPGARQHGVGDAA